MPIIKMGEEGLAHTIDNFLCSACNHRFFYEADDETGDEALYPPPEFCPKCGHGHRKLKRDIRRMNMADKFELDHATDSGSGTRYFIIHGPLPAGIGREYGYPICDSMNRHHCISPEEDEANGARIVAALNAYDENTLNIAKVALGQMLKLVEDGVLVRNTKDDGSITAFVEQSARLTRVLEQAQKALSSQLCRCPDDICLLHPNSPGYGKKCSLRNLRGGVTDER